jgi:hypothetical protein
VSIYGRAHRAGMTHAVTQFFAAPATPLCVVASGGGREIEAFYSTRHDATAEQVVTLYAMQWSDGVTFRDSKHDLGVEEPQDWTRASVERTAPLGMLLHSLVVLWFVTEGLRPWRPLDCP